METFRQECWIPCIELYLFFAYYEARIQQGKAVVNGSSTRDEGGHQIGILFRAEAEENNNKKEMGKKVRE